MDHQRISEDELIILRTLDEVVKSNRARASLEAIAADVEHRLSRNPRACMAWQPVPLDVYDSLPEGIRSSWVFVLRAGSTTGAERHPNSRQRMMSYRGMGNFQTMPDDVWISNELISDPLAPLEARWISIAENMWHQAVVPEENWVVVSFHTVDEHELIEERQSNEDELRIRQRKYIDSS